MSGDDDFRPPMGDEGGTGASPGGSTPTGFEEVDNDLEDLPGLDFGTSGRDSDGLPSVQFNIGRTAGTQAGHGTAGGTTTAFTSTGTGASQGTTGTGSGLPSYHRSNTPGSKSRAFIVTSTKTTSKSTSVPSVGPTIGNIHPRVGGLTNGEYWVGGSELYPTGAPVDVNCYRPKLLKERHRIDNILKEGLPDDLKLEMPSAAGDQLPFTTALEELKTRMEECGLDTVFRVIIQDANGRQLEVYLLEEWGKIDLQEIEDWCRSIVRIGCPYDIENLRLSAIKIRNSIGPALYKRCATLAKSNAPGPVYLKIALSQVSSLSITIVRKLSNDLSKFDLKSIPGEDVSTLNESVTNIARQIVGSGVSVPDFKVLLSQPFTTGTDEMFKMTAITVYNDCVAGTHTSDWESMLERLDAQYQELIQREVYGPAKSGKQDTDDKIHGMLGKAVDKAVSDAFGKKLYNLVPKSSNNGDTRKCFHCNEVGHIKPNCPKLQGGSSDGGITNPRHVPPNGARGEAKERTRDGEIEKWCGKCRGGKGLWTRGAGKVHSTHEHRGANDGNNEGSSDNNVSHDDVTVPAGNLGFVHAPLSFAMLGYVEDTVDEDGLHPKVCGGEE